TITIVPTEGWIYKEVLGRVEGGQTVNIRANVGGWVKSVFFKRGQEVRKNETILELYDERTEVRLLEARYNLESAKASLQETQRKYDRNKLLFEKGIIAKDEVDSNFNKLESDKAKVKALEASYNRTKWDYDNLEIKSPIRGELVEVDPDIGQEVLNGEIVAKVVNLKTKRVIAGVDVKIARLIKDGMEVEMYVNNNGKDEFAVGKVIGVSQNFDDISGTYEVEYKIKDSSVNWWPGEILTIKIPVKKLTNVVKVPRTSVLSDSNEIFVFVVKDGTTVKVPVDVSWANDKSGFIAVESFPKDSQIIIEGNTGLTSGQQVNVVN
ncbi:MAG: efflux RND transporter periplasmic adaptor subunit, partial [Candidatus Dadabacteria bacterium]|nr:efflux RND transporter periplasmic adaptor subunit [Candidatus Dadabacteria bacterium]NIQ17119.1 efflux RND transporter periplasmic adaptor subunit [Candidatus Dadabacteria bacterium]